MPPFADALQKFTARTVIGADLSSSQWADVPQGLRERAIWSARVMNLQHVQTLKDGITSILNPQTVRRADRVTPQNPEGYVTEGKSDATVRAEIKQLLQRLNHDPGAKAGGIQDLSSDGRINLQIRMNVESAQGYGQFLQGQAEGAIDAFPAQELFRAEDREEPRNWPTRWMQAGGQIFGGRMIALKNDPIWIAISAFDNPFPPFDYNSGMWVRDVSREDAIALGLLGENETIAPVVADYNAGLEASVKNVDPELVRSLQQSFGEQIVVRGETVAWRASTPTVAPPLPAPQVIPAPTPVIKPAVPASAPAIAPAPIATPKATAAAPATGAPADAAPAAAVRKPVSAAIKPPASGAVRKLVAETMAAIDSVHDDGTLPEIPVMPYRGDSYLGALHSRQYGGQIKAEKISVKAGGPWPMLTAAHETGHLLDLEAIGQKGRFATEHGDAGISEVIQAMKETNAVRLLQQRKDAATSYRERSYHDYMLNPKELWARGYAQFIAQESGNKTLKAELAKAQSVGEGRQWSTDDFTPVAAAMRKLFKNLNWL